MTEHASKISMTTFENPNNLPLEKVELVVYENGTPKIIPALSKEWMEKRYFMRYEIPNIYHDNGQEIVGAKDRWMEITNYIVDDLDWLLKLPFYKFWSNIVYDRSIIDSLVSFLQDSPTFYNFDKFPNVKEMQDLLEKIRQKVLMVFIRIVTNKVSPSEYMNPKVHGSLLYEQFLITVPIMMDLCQLYGRENGKIVTKIIKNAVKLQALYRNDFTAAAQFFSDLLVTIEQRYVSSKPIDGNGVIRISDNHHIATITLQEIEDVIMHLVDISSNISNLLTIYPPAIEFFGSDFILMKIISIYETTMPEIYKKLHELAFTDANIVMYMELKHLMHITRMEILKIFRTVTFNDIAKLLEKSNPSEEKNARENVEHYLNALTNILSEKDFIRDYNTVYPIEAELDMLQQIVSDIDPVKMEFLRRSIPTLYYRSESRQKNLIVPQEPTPGPSSSEDCNSVAGASTTELKSSIKEKSVSEIKRLIINVKDIMCDLGEGFIERCLRHYNYDTAAVINAILEDSLPAELKELDRSLPYIPPDPNEASAMVDKALGVERLNIFDGDEFDVMTRDNIDTSRVHRGKRKGKFKNVNELLNDKSFKQDAGGIYAKYGIIEDEYDDEYDDTYESQDVGLRGVDDPLEMDAKPFITPRVLRVNDKTEIMVEEDEEEESENTIENGRQNFLQDPAVLRAKAEQRRLSNRGGKRPQGDLVGKPKGQGNDKDVLINRDKKNTNKASRANHHRRSGAEWKRRQGMVPS